MASDLEAKAKEAFVEDHFELAVDLLSQAIHLEPNKAELYADRAQANIKLNNFTGTPSLPPLKKVCVFRIPFCLFCIKHRVLLATESVFNWVIMVEVGSFDQDEIVFTV